MRLSAAGVGCFQYHISREPPYRSIAATATGVAAITRATDKAIAATATAVTALESAITWAADGVAAIGVAAYSTVKNPVVGVTQQAWLQLLEARLSNGNGCRYNYQSDRQDIEAIVVAYGYGRCGPRHNIWRKNPTVTCRHGHGQVATLTRRNVIQDN